MLLDTVDIARQRTRGKDTPSMYRVRQARWWVGVLCLALLLGACGSDESANRRTPSGGEPAVAVATTAPGRESPTLATTTAPPTLAPTPTPPAPLAALVNGQYVFLADYERRVAQYEQALQQQGIDSGTDEGQGYLAQARRDVLEGLIDGVLIEQGGATLGITMGDEELESQVEADIEAGGGQEAFQEWLQSTGQTREDYKGMLRQSLLSQRVMDAVTVGVSTEAEQVHARHIMVESEEAAQQILTMLQEGADFVTLAREQSVDVATKDNGGDLGWFPRGLVAPELENAAFALQPGQISGIVPLGEGYHIIQVVEREAARPLAPEIQLDLRLALFEEWLAAQRESASIERFVGE
jgi:parvulin-like peptidyl-prolyl isomerase